MIWSLILGRHTNVILDPSHSETELSWQICGVFCVRLLRSTGILRPWDGGVLARSYECTHGQLLRGSFGRRSHPPTHNGRTQLYWYFGWYSVHSMLPAPPWSCLQGCVTGCPLWIIPCCGVLISCVLILKTYVIQFCAFKDGHHYCVHQL